ncbi:MAG: T9SS type A sorting domain-containing protein, partial [Bacteroidota bacterium]
IIPISTTVTIVQSGPSAALNVTPALRTVTDPAGSATFTVAANTTWTSSSDANWCQVTNSGSGNGIISATYQQNLTPYVRTANIQVTGAGAVPATVQVLQLPSFVSVDENPESAFQVFPNPTSGLFVLSGASTEMLFIRVTIFDPQGKTILTRQCTGANSYSFDLSKAGSGSYFMKVESKGKTHMMKVIVQ